MSEEEIIEVITYKLYMNAPILYAEIQSLLDLYNKEKEKNANLLNLLNKSGIDTINLVNDVNTNYISKDKIRNFFEERLLKYTEADDGKYDKPYLTRGELELVDRYGECKEIAEILLAEKIELPKECISKDKIRDLIAERKFELQQEFEDFDEDIVLKVLNELLEE